MNSNLNVFSKSFNRSKSPSIIYPINNKKNSIFKVISQKKVKYINNNKIKDEKLKYIEQSWLLINNIIKKKKIKLNENINNKLNIIINYFYFIIEKQIYLNQKYILIKKILLERNLFNPIQLRNIKIKELNIELVRLIIRKNKLAEKTNIQKIKNLEKIKLYKNKSLNYVKSNLLSFSENLNYFYKNDKNILIKDMKKFLK